MRADIQCFNCGHDTQAEWCFCPTCGEALAIAAILSEALAAPDCRPIVYNAPGVPASGQAARDVPDVAKIAALERENAELKLKLSDAEHTHELDSQILAHQRTQLEESGRLLAEARKRYDVLAEHLGKAIDSAIEREGEK